MTEVKESLTMHLDLDGFGCHPDRIGNLDVIYPFLDLCPALIHLVKAEAPHVYRHASKVMGQSVISGFLLVRREERVDGGFALAGIGHISLHCFPERNSLWLDILFSEEFDPQPAIEFVVEQFEVFRYEKKITSRGRMEPPLEIPDDVA